jgi:hypothetical protein
MGTKQLFSSKRSKVALIGSGSLVAIVVLGYFAFFYPPQSEQDVRGTIGGVKKYRSSQIDEKDVQLGNQATGSEQNDNVAIPQSDLTGNKTGDKTGSKTGDMAASASTGFKTGDKTGSKTGDMAASASTGFKTGDKTGSKTGDMSASVATGDKTGSKTGEKTGSKTGDRNVY